MYTIAEFIEECCEVGDDLFVSCRALHTEFENWRERNHLPPLSDNFNKGMEAEGYSQGRSRRIEGTQTRTWEGLALRVEPMEDESAPQKPKPRKALMDFRNVPPAGDIDGHEITAPGAANPGAAPFFVTLRPADAPGLLARSQYNRTLRKHRIQEYRAAMNAGRWHPHVGRVDFDWHGALINGHHTLHALAHAECESIRLVCTLDNDPEAYIHIDRTGPKEPKDELSRRGFRHSAELAGAALFIAQYERGMWRDLVETRISIDEICGAAERHPELGRYLELPAFLKGKPFPAPVFRGLRYLICRAEPARGEEFFRQLASGVGLEDGSRQRWLIKAWNAHGMPGTIRRIQFKSDEKFPLIVTGLGAIETMARNLSQDRPAGDQVPQSVQ